MVPKKTTPPHNKKIKITSSRKREKLFISSESRNLLRKKMSGSRTSITSVGVRATEVKNLKILKSPEEGGTKKDFEDFAERIANHVAISWKEERILATC